MYFRYELGKIKKERHLSVNWPDEHNIKGLVERVDCLFVYAAPAYRWIGDWNFLS